MIHDAKTVHLATISAVIWLVAALGACGAVFATDCNGNGQDDDVDIDLGVSADCNGNRVPDECDLTVPTLHAGVEIPFDGYDTDLIPIAADFDGDGALDLAALHEDTRRAPTA